MVHEDTKTREFTPLAFTPLLLFANLSCIAMPDDIECRLVHATLGCNHALVKELLDSGADLELAGEAAARLLGGKPLLFALVFYGWDPDLAAEPMARRVTHGAFEYITRILVAAGIDVDARNYDGRTALHKAVHHRWREMVRILLLAGADVNAAAIEVEENNRPDR